ncbi:MAG: hypothetical protein NT018_01050 [Armatimonadetes bacterium]|nr:hypothetical protein [Armatimonadota bacterium]
MVNQQKYLALWAFVWIERQFSEKEEDCDSITGKASESMCAGFDMLDTAIQALSHCVCTTVP